MTSVDPFGTPSYAAPEIMLGQPHNKGVDVWSLGIIIHLLLTGYLPFDDEDCQEIYRKTIQDEINFKNPSFNGVSNEAKDVLKNMLVKKPS